MIRRFDPENTKPFPVNAARYPLTGRTTGDIYMPPPAPRSSFWRGLRNAVLIMAAVYGAIIWYYTDAPNPWALLTGGW